MSDRIEGLEEAEALFERLLTAARHELADTIGRISRDVLAEQQALVANATGFLRSGLSIQLITERLRARIGLFGIRGGKGSKRELGNRYYGRFVNFGRKAQTVIVQRRRRIAGRLRSARGRKIAGDVVATYRLKVKARAAREFIAAPNAQQAAASRLAAFWSNTLSGASA